MSGRRQTQGHTANVASGGGGVCFRPILPVVKGHFEASIPFDRLSLTGRFLPVAFKVRVSEDVVANAGCVDAGKKTRKALRQSV